MRKKHCGPRRGQAAQGSGSGGLLSPGPQENQLREAYCSCPSFRGRPVPSTVWPVQRCYKTALALKSFFPVNENEP